MGSVRKERGQLSVWDEEELTVRHGEGWRTLKWRGSWV